jgi:hypothetical protein
LRNWGIAHAIGRIPNDNRPRFNLWPPARTACCCGKSPASSWVPAAAATGRAAVDPLRPVLLAAGRRALAGLTLGLAIATVATRAIRSLLFGVEALEAMTYAVVIALVLAVVAVASYLPARRAADTDPLALLRRE